MNGTRSGRTPAPPVVGDATTTPRTAFASVPKFDATAGGRTATSTPVRATVTSTVADPPAGTVTLLGENVKSVPRGLPTKVAARLYVSGEPPVLLIVNDCVSE